MHTFMVNILINNTCMSWLSSRHDSLLQVHSAFSPDNLSFHVSHSIIGSRGVHIKKPRNLSSTRRASSESFELPLYEIKRGRYDEAAGQISCEQEIARDGKRGEEREQKAPV